MRDLSSEGLHLQQDGSLGFAFVELVVRILVVKVGLIDLISDKLLNLRIRCVLLAGDVEDSFRSRSHIVGSSNSGRSHISVLSLLLAGGIGESL